MRIRTIGVVVATIALVSGCSSSVSGDASEYVAAACQANEDSLPETIDTVGPFLDEMVDQAEKAASADDSYQEFADAAVVLRDSLLNTGEGSDEDIIARQDAMLSAIETFENHCAL